MHVRDIAEQAKSEGLIESDNPDLKGAFAVSIRADIKKLGDQSRFVKVKWTGATYGLREWLPSCLMRVRMRHERRIRMAQAGDRMGT